MGNRNQALIIGALVVLALFFIIRFVLMQSPLKYDWTTQQELESKEPYGYTLFNTLLDKTYGDRLIRTKKSLVDTLPLDVTSSGYLFMGISNFIDSADVHHLIKFIENGNNAYLITEDIPWLLRQELGIDYRNTQGYFSTTDAVRVNFNDSNLRLDSALKYHVYWADTPTLGWWNNFHTHTFYDSMMVFDYAEPLAYVNESVNFARVPVGRGYLYMHLEPRLFSNYDLRTEEGLKYVNGVLSYFPENKLYFDQYNRYYHYDQDFDLGDNQSPLAYIFSQPALKYAWYVLLVTVLLFLFFSSKRRQRIIPILPSVDNTSIEFAKALGTLYYQSGRTKYLASEMMKLFHTFNRRRYNILPGKKGNNNAELIARKSKVDKKDIDRIFELERRLRYNELARMNEVTYLFHALKKYYQTARK